ncbi:hypothetical protein V1498_12925 [Peribacillus sp. SCS-26]|uniref:hypothetical protein n=1 Tax=Paraperibacillus marinus TaxID=3115295 RepID=UPI003905FF15
MVWLIVFIITMIIIIQVIRTFLNHPQKIDYPDDYEERIIQNEEQTKTVQHLQKRVLTNIPIRYIKAMLS